MVDQLMQMLNSQSIAASKSDSKATQSAAKAHIVKALKSMLNSLKYGEQVCLGFTCCSEGGREVGSVVEKWGGRWGVGWRSREGGSVVGR